MTSIILFLVVPIGLLLSYRAFFLNVGRNALALKNNDRHYYQPERANGWY